MQRITPGPGQESVWDYPRPPRVEATDKLVSVVFNDTTIAETRHALRVLETSHPPVFYIPPDDVQRMFLTRAARRSVCEFKGSARYWTLTIDDRTVTNVAWSYPDPAQAYAQLSGYFAFYPGRVDACFVDGERVQAQAGDFYGGWITSDVVGPFKGGPGTVGW